MAKTHKPLAFIEQLRFLPESELEGKKLQKYLLPFQRKAIRACLDENGNPRKTFFWAGAEKSQNPPFTVGF